MFINTHQNMNANNTMYRNVLKILILINVLLCSSSIMAGQYIKIDKIDASTSYPKITMYMTVSGADGSINVLDEGNITITEDGSRIDDSITIKKVNDTETYLYLVFSIDSSKSISKKFLKSIKSSARAIAKSIDSNDKIAVYKFNNQVVLLNDFSQSVDEIINNINGVERHGSKTLLYNSIYDSIELFDKVKQINKKVIVFTDGKDEGSSISDEDIIQFARNAMIPIYFICCKDSKNIRTMARISKLTGGKLIYSNVNDVCGMYRTILSAIKNRYSISYSSKLDMDGKNHEIEVRLKHKDIRDRDREIFYIEKKQNMGLFLLNNTSIIAINFILLIILFAVIIYFIFREKSILRERLDFEKKYIFNQVHNKNAHQTLKNDEEEQWLEGKENRYSGAWLYQKNGSEMGEKYLIQSKEIDIGSGRENNIVINDSGVSDKHLRIKNINGLYTLFDLISDDGTYLNGKKLLRPKKLYDWDEIRIGSTILIFRATQLING